MKKLLISIVAIVILSVAFAGCASHVSDFGEELIKNGGFESSNESWTLINDSNSPITPSFVTVQEGSDEFNSDFGHKYITINGSSGGSYCYYTQPIKLERNAVYMLSVNMRVNSEITASSTTGAFFGLAEAAAVRGSYTEVTSGWTKRVLYFRNSGFDEVHVRVGLGTEGSSIVAGSASFDNVSLTKVTAPTGVYIATIGEDSSNNYATSKAGTAFTVLVAVLSAIFLYGAYIVIRRLMQEKKETVNTSGNIKRSNIFNSPAFLLSVVLLLAFGMRILMVNVMFGFGPHINSMGANAYELARVGPVTYYFENSAPYAPGTLYILWVLGVLAKSFNLLTGTTGLAIFLKIPAIIADLVAVFVIFNYASAKFDVKRGALFAGIYAVLPTFFIASSVWGAYSSIGSLFLLLAFFAILDKRYIKMTIYYSAAVLFMSEALIVLPLILVFCVYMYIKDESTRNILPICMTVAIISTYLITLPFAIKYFALGSPFIVLERYVGMFTLNKLFSDNVFNVYGILNLNAKTANTAGIVMGAILAAGAMLYSIAAYIKCRNRLDMLLLGSFVFVFIYTFSVRMSVWFVLPAYLLMFMYAIIANENRVLLSFMGFSTLTALNGAYILHVGGYVKGGFNTIANVVISGSDPVLIIFSILYIALSLYFTYVVSTICFLDSKQDIPKMNKPYFEYLKDKFAKTKISQEQEGDKER